MPNSKTLILTEKPSVARDFALALSVSSKGQEGFLENEKYIITWAIGHLLAPLDPEDYDVKYKKWSIETLPILPLEFKFKAQPKTKKQLEVIKRLLKRHDLSKVIVATDAGREGELIARLILNEVKVKIPIFRFWTSAALTKEVIHSELSRIKPLSEFDRLYIAGSARQKADWMVGMNLSRLATIKLNDLFSVGRVQTAVLNLLVDRRKAIENFKSEDYFEFIGKFQFKSGEVRACWFDPLKKEDEKRLNSKAPFEVLLNKIKDKPGLVKKLETIEKTVYPQGLYSLTELQRQANIQYGFSATKTLEMAQSLYEKYKCLSYPRTDSKVMASSSFDLVKGLVFKFKELYPSYFEKFAPSKLSIKNKTVFDDARLTDHHGLIPLKDFSGEMNSPEGKIYELVLKRFITNFLENYRYLETDLIIVCENEHFKAKGKKIVELGFKQIEGHEEDDLLPDITAKEKGLCEGGSIEAKKTKAPFDYTEASLLYDMTNPARLVNENNLKKIFRTEVGLGTQATRAQIIETLLKRVYIERSGKSLRATAKGVLLIEKLINMPSTQTLTNVSQTAKLELALQSMAEGECDDKEFLKEIELFILNATSEWSKLERVERDPSKPKNYGGKTYGDRQTSAKSGIGKCPLCQSDIKDFPKSYSCSRWKEGCGFTIWKIIASKKLSQSHIDELMKSKVTKPIKGFKSRAGKSFEACLKLDQNGKVEFQFIN